MFSRMTKRGKLGLIVVFALVISVVFFASAMYHNIGSFHFCPMISMAYKMGQSVS